MKKGNARRFSRLARIEKKIDLMLSIGLSRHDRLDEAVDRMHRQARRLRELSERERDIALSLSKHTRP